MRILLPSLALLLVACSEADPRPAPTDRFLFPSGIHYRSVAGSTRGVLYVSSANFDRCFDEGTVMAVDLDRVGEEGNRLPLLSETRAGAPTPVATFEQLNVAPESVVYIQSYAGELAFWERPDAAPRIFVTARADGDYLHYIDVPEPTRLACVGSPSSTSSPVSNCIAGALSLTAVPGQTLDLPRAPAPFGVGVGGQGDVWVTHLGAADSPARSLTAWHSYVVRLSGAEPAVSTSDFFSLAIPNLPVGSSNSVVVDDRYVFVSGRFVSTVTDATNIRRFLLRVLDKNDPSRLIDPGLDLTFAANDARGLALTAPPTASGVPRRLYLAVRAPDSLLVVNAEGTLGDTPRLSVVGSVPLPLGPTEVKLLPRDGTRGELVLVSCSDAGVVAIYDPDVGQVVAQVSVGQITNTESPHPFGVEVQKEGNSARIFVSNFGDGRISVIDIPDLNNPQDARLVAYLGARQDVGQSATCREVQQ